MYRATLCFGNSIVNRTTATHVASTCATGFASVFTIGGLYVACFGRCLGKVVSLGSYLQAFGRKSTGKASGTQDLPDESIGSPTVATTVG